MTGKNVAFPSFSAFGAEKDTLCDVPDIDEVVAAFNGERQTAADESGDKTGYVSAFFVTRADDSRRMNDGGVESFSAAARTAAVAAALLFA